jgi:dephospho-CoA kinase
MKKVFYITGISGAGKSTVVEKLAEKGVFPIDADSVKGLTHWIGKLLEKYRNGVRG